MRALSMLVALQAASYGPPNISAPEIGQPAHGDQSGCPAPSGNEIVVCKTQRSTDSPRYRDTGPSPSRTGLSDPFTIKLPGGATLRGFRQLKIPF